MILREICAHMPMMEGPAHLAGPVRGLPATGWVLLVQAPAQEAWGGAQEAMCHLNMQAQKEGKGPPAAWKHAEAFDHRLSSTLSTSPEPWHHELMGKEAGMP